MPDTKEMSADMAALIKSIQADRNREDRKEFELKSITDRVDDKTQRLDDLEIKERYFFDNLFNNPVFGDGEAFGILSDMLPDLATNYKRTAVLYLTFKKFVEKTGCHGLYTLNTKIVSKVIERYIDDLNILKKRYDCKRVQLSKIAGLITNLIVRYRPVVPLDTGNDPHRDMNDSFALYHALCICSDFSEGVELEDFENSDKYHTFMEDMKYLFSRNFTPENLIMVFKTLCLYQFPSFLKKEVVG